MKTLIAAALALTIAAPAMAQGFWSQQQGSIYGHSAPTYQWNDRSNSGELYTAPPHQSYQSRSTSCTSTQIGRTVFTDCN